MKFPDVSKIGRVRIEGTAYDVLLVRYDYLGPIDGLGNADGRAALSVRRDQPGHGPRNPVEGHEHVWQRCETCDNGDQVCGADGCSFPIAHHLGMVQ